MSFRDSAMMPTAPRQAQSGVTLTEVLVGLVIGLVAVAVAVQTLATLQVTQSETSQRLALQSSVRYVLSNIAREIRHAGSAQLSDSTDHSVVLTPFSPPAVRIDPSTSELTLQYATPFASDNVGCLWRQSTTLGPSVTSHYALKGRSLRCTNNGFTQPLIDGVLEFVTMLAIKTPSGLRWITSNPDPSVQALGLVVCLHVLGPPMQTPQAPVNDCTGQVVVADGRLHVVEHQTTALNIGAWP